MDVQAVLNFMSLNEVIELAGHIKCRYMIIKAKSYKSSGNWEKYLQILEIIKRNAKQFVYKEYNGVHHLHLNNPECLVSDVNIFIQQSICSSL